MLSSLSSPSKIVVSARIETTTASAPASTLPLDKLAVGLAFGLGLATIAGAWGSQLWGGLVPCELCLEQRVAYYWGLPVLALVLILWNRLPLTVWYVGVALAAAIFAWSVYMGGYHAGVDTFLGLQYAALEVCDGAPKLRGICTASVPPGARLSNSRTKTGAWSSIQCKAALE